MQINSVTLQIRIAACLLKLSLTLALTLSSVVALAQDPGNGIHVGDAKVYDARELTLMLDSFNQQLQGKNFVDQSKLAAALGNVQGYQSTDTSTSLFLNGAVGPQAAAVFAGNLPASRRPSGVLHAQSDSDAVSCAIPSPAAELIAGPISAALRAAAKRPCLPQFLFHTTNKPHPGGRGLGGVSIYDPRGDLRQANSWVPSPDVAIRVSLSPVHAPRFWRDA